MLLDHIYMWVRQCKPPWKVQRTKRREKMCRLLYSMNVLLYSFAGGTSGNSVLFGSFCPKCSIGRAQKCFLSIMHCAWEQERPDEEDKRPGR